MNSFFKIAQIIIPTTPVPGQRGLSLAELGSLIALVGSFLTNVAVIVAVIFIIVSGIMYMKAGGNPDAVKKAQAWFKNALLGGLIVLGSGVLINTLANVVSREFFCRLSVPIVGCIF